jgi:hypothetical protein
MSGREGLLEWCTLFITLGDELLHANCEAEFSDVSWLQSLPVWQIGKNFVIDLRMQAHLPIDLKQL